MEGHECSGCGGGVAGINVQEIVRQAQQQQKKPKRWSEKIKELLTDIEAEKPEDRLQYAIAFTKLFHALTWCIAGWGQWLGFQIALKGTPVVASYAPFERMTLDECKTTYPKVKAVVVKMLNIDYEISFAKEEEGIKQAKVKTEETKKKPKAKRKTKKSKADKYIQ